MKQPVPICGGNLPQALEAFEHRYDIRPPQDETLEPEYHERPFSYYSRLGMQHKAAAFVAGYFKAGNLGSSKPSLLSTSVTLALLSIADGGVSGTIQAYLAGIEARGFERGVASEAQRRELSDRW